MTFNFNTLNDYFDGWETITENTQVGDWFVVSVDDSDDTCLYRRDSENEFTGYDPKQQLEFSVLTHDTGEFHCCVS